MAWTDERVELLKKLWGEGLSASQIAGRLGSVTRNAVIGKVHRLGLSGRATTSRMKSHRPRPRMAAKRMAKTRFSPLGNPAFRALYAEAEAYQPPVEELVIPHQRAQIHPDADRVQLPLADRRPASRRVPLLRQEQGAGPALLRVPRAPRLPAAADAPPRARDRRARDADDAPLNPSRRPEAATGSCPSSRRSQRAPAFLRGAASGAADQASVRSPNT